MNLFGFDSPTQSGFQFPQPLTEKYRPAKIQDFAGLDKVKRILTKFAANPPVHLVSICPVCHTLVTV